MKAELICYVLTRELRVITNFFLLRAQANGLVALLHT